MDNEIPKKIIQKIDDLHNKSDFVVSWFAKKYNKTIFRLGTLNKDGCRTWEDYKGNKLMCFWDVVIERYTTCINPCLLYTSPSPRD